MLSFANATGNLFNRLGKIGLSVKQLKSYQTSQQTNYTDTVIGLVAQYNAESDLQAQVGNSYIGILNSSDQPVSNLAQNLAATTINRMVFRDNPRLSQTLADLQVPASIQEVIRQMKVAGASVLAMTVTGTPVVVGSPGPHFAGTGNGILNVSTKRPFDGLTLENTFAENLTCVCTADSYLSGVPAGNETIQISGAGNQTDFYAFNWPLGSNSRKSVAAINSLASNNQSNILTNSDFETWSGNLPVRWTLPVGTIGTSIVQDTGNVYRGGSALKLVGDGTTKTQWTQQFNTSTGTLGRLSPLTQYSFCVFLRRDAVAPGAGNLTVELVGPGNVQILDANGVANAFNINLTALSTQYQAFTTTWRTPEILPSQAFLNFRLNTALTNGRSVFVDSASMGVMQQMYTSGPYVAVHSGSVNFVLNDLGTITITNSRGAAGTLSTFQTLWAQLYPQMLTQEFLLPSSATPTISDTLIG